MFPLLRDLSLRWALSIVAASIVWCAMQAMDNAHILSILSLSQRMATKLDNTAAAAARVSDL